VGVAGDSLEIIDGKVYVNNSPLQLPDRAKPQFSYLVQGKGRGFNMRSLIEIYGITDGLQWVDRERDLYQVNAITEENLAKFRNHPNVKSVQRISAPKNKLEPGIFPNNGKVAWNKDNLGPIYIPKAGKTVQLNLESFPIYRRIIEVYEGSEMGIENTLEVKGSQVYLNGDPIDEYTFKQDYYWMMGDNRHNSEDSRYWGYVPHNHVVGKPVFVWMSLDGNASNLLDKVRWERLFTTVGGEGKPTSYFVYFLIGLVLIIGYNYFIKKKK
jgi:signal peptidase I